MPDYGLYPARDFLITRGDASDCTGLAPALWYFRDETIAIPGPGRPLAGFSRELPLLADLQRWAAATPVGSVDDYPPLIWLAAPDILPSARLTADLKHISYAGQTFACALAPRLPLNGAWLDASSAAWLAARPLQTRGRWQGNQFVVHSLWPGDFSLPMQPPLRPLPAEPGAVQAWVRALPQGGAQSPFGVEAIWQRSPASCLRPGQPVIGLMLNGAQGDDDEAHGGHFALMTGRVGVDGSIGDWLVFNFYTLDTESEKGILAAPVPLANYLADLNAGQAWYRPSCLLVAGLRDERTARHLQSAMARVFNQFYRHQFAYQHARANCAGISIASLRAIGWQVPRCGAESWLKASLALPLSVLRDASLQRGRAIFDYLTEERSTLYPAVAFAAIGADLLRLAQGEAKRVLGEFETCLAADLEQLLLVRIPQFPSSRAWGDWPVVCSHEYAARLPADPAARKIIPVPARPFPPALRDPLTPREAPLRSSYALLAWALCLLVGFLLIVARLLA